MHYAGKALNFFLSLERSTLSKKSLATFTLWRTLSSALSLASARQSFPSTRLWYKCRGPAPAQAEVEAWSPWAEPPLKDLTVEEEEGVVPSLNRGRPMEATSLTDPCKPQELDPYTPMIGEAVTKMTVRGVTSMVASTASA